MDRSFKAQPLRVAARIGAGCMVLAGAHASRAETLDDAITLAYQNNPTLQEERATLRALDETYVQARAGYRPQLSVSVEADYQQGTPIVNGVVTPAGPQGADAALLSLNQTLFDGGQTSAQVRAAMGDILSERQKLRQTEANVMQSVVQAYADTIRDTNALAIDEANIKALRQLLEEIKANYDVGQYTRTDLSQAQASLAGALAQLAGARAQLEISRSNYRLQVGQNPGDLAPWPPLRGIPGTLEGALQVALENSPGVGQADFAEKAAAARVALAKAAFRPNLSLRATYGVDGTLANQSNSSAAQAVGVYARQATASVVLTEPLFAGGMNASKVRQAAEDDNTRIIAVDAARRQAIQAVDQAWSQAQANKQAAAAAQDEVAAAQIDVQGSLEELRLGDRTAFDVLTAQALLASSRLSLNLAQHDQYVASATLLAAMGMLEVRYLIPRLKLYDPQTAFNKVRRAGSVPWEGLFEALDTAGGANDKHRPPAPPVALPSTATDR